MKPYINREENQYLNSLPIYKHVRFQVLSGWINFIYEKGKEITACCQDEGITPLPIVTQVRRKNGELEILINTKNPELILLLMKIKEDSKTCCEICGEYSLGRYNVPMKGIYTLCNNHTIKGFERVE